MLRAWNSRVAHIRELRSLAFHPGLKNQLFVTSRDVRDFTRREKETESEKETPADKTAYRDIAEETTIGRFKR